MIRKLQARSVFVFVPWLTFWNHGGSDVLDQTKLRIIFSSSTQCAQKGKIFLTTVVRTPESRAKGLSKRKKLMTDDEAMMFLYEDPRPMAFWMKETYIPLQAAYFDAKGKLTQVTEMPVEKDPSRPTRQYPSFLPALVALELKPGTLKPSQEVHLCVDI